MIRWIGRLVWLLFFVFGVWCIADAVPYWMGWKPTSHWEGLSLILGIPIVAITLLLVPRTWPQIIPGFRKQPNDEWARIVWYIWWVLVVIFMLPAIIILFGLLALAYEHSALPAIFGGYYGYQ